MKPAMPPPRDVAHDGTYHDPLARAGNPLAKAGIGLKETSSP
jgi:hypothetical protein